MQVHDSPHIQSKIALARQYGDRIKSLSSVYDTQVDRIFKRHIALLKNILVSGGDATSVVDSLLASLRELLEALITGCTQVACEREDEDSDTQLSLLLATVPQCAISYYDDTLTRYRSILINEIAFAKDKELVRDIDLFLFNPMAYMSSRKGGLLDLKENVEGVFKGVSYSFMDNMKKLGISAAALAYANAEYELWRNEGYVAGYIGVRNSNFPCPLCDSYAYRFTPMSEGMVYPLHNRCVCSIIPLHQNELL